MYAWNWMVVAREGGESDPEPLHAGEIRGTAKTVG